uniref:NAD synthase n=1 Tax=Candidatus Kentrum sp. TUN TaxID=2126343 RepID=A0A451A419_9GAMM|nr:MAG: NAD synthase [Candidatus Kentron sp. TUN]
MNSNSDDRFLNIRKQIVDWLSNHLINTGKAGFVIGLSGGIDSLALALMSREATEKCGKDHLTIIFRLDVFDHIHNIRLFRF